MRHPMKQSTLNTTTWHWLALCALVLCTLSLPAHAARLALVIGNDQYEQHKKLYKAGNDADAMAALLKRSGFTVVNESLRRDLSRAQMNQVFSQLVQKVRRDDEVVVFYSGHGLQYGDQSVITGKDFPKPFDRTLALSEGIQLKAWQETIRGAGARFALFVLDACREDITEGGMVKSMTGEDALFRTMEPTNPPEGQIVIFSARSGQLALDRLSNADPNPNGVFTRVFLEEAQKPGVSILDVVGETEDRVAQLAATVKDRRTGQPHRQKPAVRNEAGQRVKFCFVPNNGQCGEPGPIPAPRVAVDAEQEAWDLAKRSHSAGAYQAYASAYPQGRYAQAAQVALAGFRPVQIASNKLEPNSAAAPHVAASSVAISVPVLGEATPWKNAALEVSTNASRIALAEWRKADNRSTCSPLGLASNTGHAGQPRRAVFRGGWAVAFDLAENRSAYGIAGAGSEAETDTRLKEWPHFRSYADGSAVGYGLSGRGVYSAENPDGRGQESLAYLRISGQLCSYNIWSKLGRQHLELLIGELRLIKTR